MGDHAGGGGGGAPQAGLEVALRSIFDALEVVVASRDASSAAGVLALSVDEQRHMVMHALPEGVTRQRLHFVATEAQVAAFSSSALREAVAAHDAPTVRAMLPECLLDYVQREGLYSSETE